jgi:hypothetical protein
VVLSERPLVRPDTRRLLGVSRTTVRLWSAERIVGRESRTAESLQHDEAVALLRAHKRL